MDNKSIARLLRKALKASECQSDRYGKINEPNVVVGTETKIDASKLAASVRMLADMLEESYNSKCIEEYDGENARFG